MKKFLLMFIFISFFSFSKNKMSVTFINPGKSNETFWVMVSNFMKASAKDLDINLEIKYGERNQLNDIKIAKEIVNRTNKPDYLIIVNEKLVAEEIINMANDKGIKTFLILNELSSEQKKRIGEPRIQKINYIGSLIPNNIDAGYLIGKSLLDEANKNSVIQKNIIAINGNRVTPAGVDREQGLLKIVNDYKNVEILQTVYAEWESETAYNMAKGLLQRYFDTNIIWAANDPMAIGAISAAEKMGRNPGKDIFIGGLNWSKEALALIKKGSLTSSVGGHFMVGGWALVILYDYHDGMDFLKTEGNSEINTDIFGIIDKSNIKSFEKVFKNEDWNKINFKMFSKKENKQIKKYKFGLSEIMKQFK